MEKAKTSKTSWVRELRASFPVMSMAVFCRLFEEHSGSDNLLDVLFQAEAEAMERERAAEETNQRMLRQLAALGQHLLVALPEVPGVDTEHAQAMICFGFFPIGRKEAYVGDNPLSVINLRTNVRNKLGQRFSDEKFNAVIKAWTGYGVIRSIGRKNSPGLAFNVNQNATDVKSHGAMVIKAVHSYVGGRS